MKGKKWLIALLITVLIFSNSFVLAADTNTNPVPAPSPSTTETQQLEVHFLDVGQADSTLIQLPNNQIILIDGGNSSDAEFICKYIQDHKIKKIDYLIGTHPHEDHIGGLEAIIKTFDIGKIYMPKVAHTTETYKNLLLTIKDKKLSIQDPVVGTNIIDEADIKFKILAPNSSQYKDLNDYSIVTKLTYKKNSFLFTGDAEKVSEDEILAKKFVVKADVLKVGHHGSTSSTSPAFVKAVSPKYSIISVGKDNSYNHPDNIIINRLKLYGEVFRTDLDGTVIITSDGEHLTIGKQIKAAPTEQKEVSQTVYISKTGTKYHKENCSYLSNSKIPISLDDAKAKGYTPCSRCKP